MIYARNTIETSNPRELFPQFERARDGISLAGVKTNALPQKRFGRGKRPSVTTSGFFREIEFSRADFSGVLYNRGPQEGLAWWDDPE